MITCAPPDQTQALANASTKNADWQQLLLAEARLISLLFAQIANISDLDALRGSIQNSSTGNQ